MSRKPVVPRAAANRDIEAIVDDYAALAGIEVAERFVTELERAFDQIARHPASGSPHYALELRIPGLRAWSVRRFPYLLFYVERDAAVEIWRVLQRICEPSLPNAMPGPGRAPSSILR